jgi:hypothetical protein
MYSKLNHYIINNGLIIIVLLVLLSCAKETPKGWPVRFVLYPNAKIIESSRTTSRNSLVLKVVASSNTTKSDLFQFYKKQANSIGFVVPAKIYIMPERNTLSILYDRDNEYMSISCYNINNTESIASIMIRYSK